MTIAEEARTIFEQHYRSIENTVEQEISSLVFMLNRLAGYAHFLHRCEHKELLEHDATLWRLLGDFEDGRLRHDLETVRADYSEDQLSAFDEEGYPHFTTTGILIHYGRDPVKGLYGVQAGYDGIELRGHYHCHVQTSPRWREVMDSAAESAREELQLRYLLLKRPRASAGTKQFEERAKRYAAASGGRQRRIRATPNAQKYEAFAKEAQNRPRTGKTLVQIAQEIFGSKTKKVAEAQIGRCREWVKNNRLELNWWGEATPSTRLTRA